MTQTALAQAPRSSVAIAASTGAPEFKDPKTGQIRTPETVSQDGKLLTGPDDKAFNPSVQNVPVTMMEPCVAARSDGAGHGGLNPDSEADQRSFSVNQPSHTRRRQ